MSLPHESGGYSQAGRNEGGEVLPGGREEDEEGRELGLSYLKTVGFLAKAGHF